MPRSPRRPRSSPVSRWPRSTTAVASRSGRTASCTSRPELGGKILRINPDGSIPPDNPFPGSPVWSLGHRNVQGLAWDSTGRMWAIEYGANGLDELNLIKPGGNYGWPMAEGRAGMEGLTDPMLQWPVGEASPSGLAFYGGALWVAALRGQRLFRVPVGADGMLGEAESMLAGLLGDSSVLVVDDDVHRERRRLMTAPFHRDAVAGRQR